MTPTFKKIYEEIGSKRIIKIHGYFFFIEFTSSLFFIYDSSKLILQATSIQPLTSDSPTVHLPDSPAGMYTFYQCSAIKKGGGGECPPFCSFFEFI